MSKVYVTPVNLRSDDWTDMRSSAAAVEDRKSSHKDAVGPLRLMNAVVQLVIHDLCEAPLGSRDFNTAWRYFHRADEDIYGFPGICDIFGFDVDKARQGIYERIQENRPVHNRKRKSNKTFLKDAKALQPKGMYPGRWSDEVWQWVGRRYRPAGTINLPVNVQKDDEGNYMLITQFAISGPNSTITSSSSLLEEAVTKHVASYRTIMTQARDHSFTEEDAWIGDAKHRILRCYCDL